jgi:uncharacterized membrane protein YkoI
MQRLMWLAILAGILVHPAPGVRAADRDHDQEQARRALEAGEILPLDVILAEVHQRYPGTVVELELTREDRRWVYEVELLADDGRLRKLRIDAKSKQLLAKGDD